MSAPDVQPAGPVIERSGRGTTSPIAILAVLIATPIYGSLAWANPILGATTVGLLLQTLLFGSIMLFVVAGPNRDYLDAFRVVSIYYAMCFCVAPLFVIDPAWHFESPLGPLAAKASAYLLVSYWIIAAGYYAPIFKPLPRKFSIESLRGNPTTIRTLAVILIVVGFISWGILFIQAGGFNRIISGDEARNQWFKGVGFFFWPALFSYTGAVAYFALQIRPGARFQWLRAWPLFVAFSIWAIFQGRMRALNILVMGLLVSHYLIRPLRLSRLAIFFVGAFSFSLFVGFVRNANRRFLLFSNPAALLAELGANAFEFSQAIMVGSFSRHRQIMLILDKVPSWMPHDWGKSYLMIFNPPLRLVGLGHLQQKGIGPRIYELAHPFQTIDLNTGYLPSLPGELLVNFPFYIALPLFVFYGMGLRFIYDRLVLRRADPGSIALYAVVLLALSNMIFVSVGQNQFEFVVLTVPLVVMLVLSRLNGRSSTQRVGATSWATQASDSGLDI